MDSCLKNKISRDWSKIEIGKGISKRNFFKNFTVTQPSVSQQMSKMKISCGKREKTPKYEDKQVLKTKIESKTHQFTL